MQVEPVEVFAGAAEELERTLRAATPALRALSPERASTAPGAGRWSPAEILGHLVDSAANNHQRFVRAQQREPQMLPPYEQEHWVAVQGYREADWTELIDLWRLYNRHLARVMRRIPAGSSGREVRIGAGPAVTLGYLVEDYVAHLKHHLRQIGVP